MYRVIEQIDWGKEKTIGSFSFLDHALEYAQIYLEENYDEFWPVDTDLKEFNIVARWFGQGKSLTVYSPESIKDFRYEFCR
jgi:hypothetical protein